jgi:hypothetical protein
MIPVFAVMTGKGFGLSGKVGYLIVNVALILEEPGGGKKKVGFLILIESPDKACFLFFPEPGSPLNGQLVAGEMVGAKRQGLLEGIDPVLEGLPLKSIDQIQADIVKT